MTTPQSILLFHGLEGTPTGRKLTTLANHARTVGMTPHIPDLRSTNNPDERLRMAREQLLPELSTGRAWLVGSSMGGYVAASLACEFDVAGLLLMAPALFRAGYARQEYPVRTQHVLVLHGLQDDVVDVAMSRRFVKETAGAVLVEVHDGHRLEEQVPSLPAVFSYLLARASTGQAK